MIKSSNKTAGFFFILILFFNLKTINCQNNQSKTNKITKAKSSLDSAIFNYEKTCNLFDNIYLNNKSINLNVARYSDDDNSLKNEIAQTISSLLLNMENINDTNLNSEILKNEVLIEKINKIKTNKIKLKNVEDSLEILKIKLNELEILKENNGKFIFNKIINDNSYGSVNIEIRGVKYKIFIADTNHYNIDMHLFDYNKPNLPFKTLSNLRRFLDKKHPDKIEMLTNAGMYRGNNDPEGLFVCSNRDTFFDVDNGPDNPDLNFYMKPNGIFYCDKNGIPHIISTEKWERVDTSKVRCATQSGPLLLSNGKLHPRLNYASTNAKIRSGVGTFKKKELQSKTVFIITTNETNFIDFSEVFKYVLGCNDVLFLDGAISKMYIKTDNISDFENSNFGPILSIIHK